MHGRTFETGFIRSTLSKSRPENAHNFNGIALATVGVLGVMWPLMTRFSTHLDYARMHKASVLSRHPRFGGEIASIGGKTSGGCAPSGVEGQSPWSGGLGGKAPSSWKLFAA